MIGTVCNINEYFIAVRTCINFTNPFKSYRKICLKFSTTVVQYFSIRLHCTSQAKKNIESIVQKLAKKLFKQFKSMFEPVAALWSKPNGKTLSYPPHKIEAVNGLDFYVSYRKSPSCIA